MGVATKPDQNDGPFFTLLITSRWSLPRLYQRPLCFYRPFPLIPNQDIVNLTFTVCPFAEKSKLLAFLLLVHLCPFCPLLIRPAAGKNRTPSLKSLLGEGWGGGNLEIQGHLLSSGHHKISGGIETPIQPMCRGRRVRFSKCWNSCYF